MAKFVYRMQNILNIKYQLESQAKAAFAQANQKLRKEELKLQGFYDDIKEYEKSIKKASEKKLNIMNMKMYNEAIENKKLKIEEQKLQIKKASKAVELARKKLNDLITDRKTHERLKEQAFEEFLRELDDQEKKEIDELVSFRFNKAE